MADAARVERLLLVGGTPGGVTTEMLLEQEQFENVAAAFCRRIKFVPTLGLLQPFAV